VVAGFLLACAIMFKPNAVLIASTLIASWLINRRFRKVLEVCAGAAAGIVSCIFFSSAVDGTFYGWTSWLSAIRHLPDDIIRVESGNFAPYLLLHQRFGTPLATLATMVALPISLGFIWLGRQDAAVDEHGSRDREAFEDSLMIGLGCILYLLCGRLVWIHYLTLASPLALFIMRPADALPNRSVLFRIAAIIATTLLGLIPPVRDQLPRQQHLLAACTSYGVVLLFLLALAELKGARRRGDA
jgi:hypothetical protein